jgi:hypothetical protein
MKKRWAVVTLAVGALCCGSEISPSTTPRLELIERYSIPLPISQMVSGVRTDARRRVIVWSTADAYVTVFDDGRARRLRGDSTWRVVTAEVANGGGVEVMFAEAKRALWVLFDSAGARVRSKVADLPVMVSSGARVGATWYAAGGDASRALRLYRVSDDGSAAPILRIPRDAGGRDSGVAAVHLVNSGTDLVVVLARAPYVIWRVSSIGDSTVITRPRDDPRIDSVLVGVHRSVWVALRGVAIDSGTVQTIADLASDNRVVFVLDRRGRILTVRRIVAPLGFVDSDVSARRICALRNVTIREIVCYGWKWIRVA